MSDLIKINGKNYIKHQAFMFDGGANSPMFYNEKLDKLFLSGAIGEQGKHIGFTSDDEIKKWDWVIDDYNIIYQVSSFNCGVPVDKKGNGSLFCKKISYATDTLLRVVKYTEGGYVINGGVPVPLPKPSKTFIESYAKLYNSSKTPKIDVLVKYTDKRYKGLDNMTWIENWQPVISKDNTVSIIIQK